MVLTDKNFDEKINSISGVLLVKFYADWCHPCKILDQTLDSVAKDNENLTIAKVDMMVNKQLASRFAIRNIPTVHIYKNGEKVSQFIGLQPKEGIEKIISDL